MKKALVVAIREFFGPKPGSTLKDMMTEVQALTNEDRQYLAVEFGKVGIEIDPTTIAKPVAAV